MDDADLYRRWLETRDEDAFRELATRHADLVLDVAWRLSGDRGRAEDAVQEALLSLATDGTPRPAEVGVRAWLARRALSCGRNRRASDAARTRREHETAEARKEAAVGSEQAEFREEARRALVRLSGEQAAILSLHFLHGVEYEELARVLDVAEPTARVRVHRALEALRSGMRRAPADDTGVALAALAALPVVGLSEAARSAAVESALASAKAISTIAAGAAATAAAAAKPLALGPLVAGVGIGVAIAAVAFFAFRPADEMPAASPPPAVAPALASNDAAPSVASADARMESGASAVPEPDAAVDVPRPEGQDFTGGASSSAAMPARPIEAARAATLTPLTSHERETLLSALKGYLEPESSDAFKQRILLIRMLAERKKSGHDLLGDHDTLMSLIYAARPFLAAFSKQAAPRGIRTDPATGAVEVNLPETLTSPARRLSISLPPSYADLAKRKKLNESPPFPMIVVLHDLADFEDPRTRAKSQNPGTEAIKRLWDRSASRIPESWILFAPVAPRAMFVENGQLKVERVPLGEAYQRHHVDFDRIVLDGGSSALALAVSQPNFYAGLIVRTHESTPLVLPPVELLGNLASLRIFVDGPSSAPVVAALRAAGIADDRVTTGGAADLPNWLEALPVRVVPRAFSWTVGDRDAQGFAHWINIDAADERPEPRTLEVECVDTPQDPNTVRITSDGIRTVSLFLSDQLVDLDRPVRVVINGRALDEVNVPAKTPAGTNVRLPAKFERTVDEVFDGQLSSKKWMYYPWLWPVTLRTIQIRTDMRRGETIARPSVSHSVKPPGAGTGPVAEPSDVDPAPARPEDPAVLATQEKFAATYLEKAEDAQSAGDLDKAVRLYRKVMQQGWSSLYERAQAKVLELAPPK